MTSSNPAIDCVKCILILGGTSGIGEAAARRFHDLGKKVIITGRRQERLKKLESELPGVQTRVIDNADLTALPAHVASLLVDFADIDTVWINSGIQKAYSFTDPKSAELAAISEEVNVNVTAPILLARLFLPHLLALSRKSEPASLILTSSALAFVPLGVYPVYCPTKSAIHAFCVGLRQQLHLENANVNIIEIAPPYVETELDIQHRGTTDEQPMPLNDYIAAVFQILSQQPACEIKELAIGFAGTVSQAWRDSIGRILLDIGVGG